RDGRPFAQDNLCRECNPRAWADAEAGPARAGHPGVPDRIRRRRGLGAWRDRRCIVDDPAVDGRRVSIIRGGEANRDEQGCLVPAETFGLADEGLPREAQHADREKDNERAEGGEELALPPSLASTPGTPRGRSHLPIGRQDRGMLW